MCFDKARKNIRIHWNARVVPKAIFGGYKTTLHVDGISIYELDRQSGNITQHRLERLVMNDDQVTPEQGVFAALRRHVIQSQVDTGIPSLHRHMEAMSKMKIGGDSIHTINNLNNLNNNNNNNYNIFENGIINGNGNSKVNIQTHKIPDNVLRFQNNMNHRGSILFGDSINDDDSSLSSLKSFTTASSSRSRLNAVSSSASSGEAGDGSGSSDQKSLSHMDSAMAEALQKKNTTRKKFGLKPLDMEEFIEIEKKVQELDNQQQKIAAAAALKATELERARSEEKENKAGGFLGKLFGKALEDTCESNYDCQRPEVCCDFGLTKKCCSSGMRVMDAFNKGKMQGQLTRATIPNPNPYPGNDPRNRDRIFQ